MNKVKAAVFASGTGSNFDAIIGRSNLACEIVVLICDKPGAPVIEKAISSGIQTLVLNPKAFVSKQEYETKILHFLRKMDVEWIFLAGYMRLIGPTLLAAYEDRIINTHPSLLPAFPGKDAISQAIQAGVKVTGVTIHFVDEGMDTGPIIAQRALEVLEDDTEATLKVRIQDVEHELYPEVINRLVRG
ncbi:phosphoribosylglycinamide formyltransferase [Ornithinibacillus bavariensis]|uniref:Phosphoribosylglycinamide formyltransferase n=1 Tax=Ornithinibacillus bavariensis TaxID=545502 RepID=A0A919XAT8_9BACI|nr:phosphoribosylglycinamide formyltransferase [Ornithinibacillus bavariensis]GIO28013.1 phosphoribosylglycinamide formyltransferase [Ornithinibacillus bavariensis]